MVYERVVYVNIEFFAVRMDDKTMPQNVKMNFKNILIYTFINLNCDIIKIFSTIKFKVIFLLNSFNFIGHHSQNNVKYCYNLF